MDLPQVYIEGNTNARKNAMKGKVKGRKLTLDPAGDSFPHLDANMSVGTYNFPRVDEGNEPNTGGFKFIEMVRLVNLYVIEIQHESPHIFSLLLVIG